MNQSIRILRKRLQRDPLWTREKFAKSLNYKEWHLGQWLNAVLIIGFTIFEVVAKHPLLALIALSGGVIVHQTSFKSRTRALRLGLLSGGFELVGLPLIFNAQAAGLAIGFVGFVSILTEIWSGSFEKMLAEANSPINKPTYKILTKGQEEPFSPNSLAKQYLLDQQPSKQLANPENTDN